MGVSAIIEVTTINAEMAHSLFIRRYYTFRF
jgi:hypothetical protein